MKTKGRKVKAELSRGELLLLLRRRFRDNCAICGKALLLKELCVDHDHITGYVRGLLCRNCNLGLGLFQDSVGVLQRAIGYLREHGG